MLRSVNLSATFTLWVGQVGEGKKEKAEGAKGTATETEILNLDKIQMAVEQSLTRYHICS